MCGRITTVEWGELLEVVKSLGCEPPENARPDWPADGQDAFPRRHVPVVASRGESADGHQGTELAAADIFPAMLSWGYTIEGEKDVVFNTRSETMASVPLWRESYKDGHCIVPVHAFYEPHGSETAVNPRTGRKVKQLYRFTDSESPLGASLPGIFMLAGLWRTDGVFSIITAKAEEPVKAVHPRMPVMLGKQQAKEWLLYSSSLLVPQTKGLEATAVYPERPEPVQQALF